MQSNKDQPPAAVAATPTSRDGGGYGGYGYGYTNQGGADFARTWHLFLEKGWIIAVTLAICLGAGYAYVKTAPTLYSATTTVQTEQIQPNLLRMQVAQLGDLQAVDFLQTVAQNLTARPVLERVADTNQLWTDPRFAPGAKKPLTRTQAVSALERMVKVKLRRSTRLIDITVTHGNPALCATLANSIVSQYINAGAERQDVSIGLASKSLEKEAEELRNKLERSEHALQAYKEQTKASSLDDRENTVVAKLRELSTKATEAKSFRIKAETDYTQVMSLGTNIEALLNVATVAKDPTVQALVLNLTKAEDDFAALSKRYKEKHPKHIQATTLITELKGDISNAVLNAVQMLKGGVEAARASETALNEAMRTQEVAALDLSKLSIQYNVLAREVESDRALYDAVLKGMKEASVTKDTQQGGIIRVVDPAEPPELPVSPRKMAIMAMSGLAGVFLGVFLILGLRVTDTSIKTVDEAEMMLGLSVFSVVPKMRGLRNGHTRLVVAEDARSDGAEAFRTLRTSLTTLGGAEGRRVFLFTSAMPSEGKTFCSINYAASLAQLGLKTLLIDADLRKPAVETNLLGHDGSKGLTDYMLGRNKLNELAQSTKVDNLFFVSGGSTAASPAEMLAKDGLSSIILDALQHYDRVVIDSAPINAVSDTLLMVKSVQTVCLVVRASRTSSRYVLRCTHLLRSAEANVSGVILNGMPRRRGPGYGAYYDYQHHGKYGKEGVYGNH